MHSTALVGRRGAATLSGSVGRQLGLDIRPDLLDQAPLANALICRCPFRRAHARSVLSRTPPYWAGVTSVADAKFVCSHFHRVIRGATQKL